MTNNNLENKTTNHPYNSCDKVYEDKDNNVKFFLYRATRYVVDDYDDVLGSVELSHHEDLGYYKIRKLSSPYPLDVLDLTWMDKEDIFNFESNPQYQSIKQIHVNIDNLGFSYLPIGNDYFNNIQLVVYNNNSSISTIIQIKNFKTFIREHASAISKGIELVGFSPIIALILEKIANNYGINVLIRNLQNGKKHK